MNQAHRHSPSTEASRPTKMSRAIVLRCFRPHLGKALIRSSPPWGMSTMSRRPRLFPRSLMEGGHGFEAPAQRHHIPAKFPLPARLPTQPRAPPLPLPLVLARIRAQETLETLIPCHEE